MAESEDENYKQWGLWQKKADQLAAENRQLRAQLEARQLTSVHRIDELPQAVRIAVVTAAKAYVHRWHDTTPENSDAAEKLAIDELVQLLVNVYTLPERDVP